MDLPGSRPDQVEDGTAGGDGCGAAPSVAATTVPRPGVTAAVAGPGVSPTVTAAPDGRTLDPTVAPAVVSPNVTGPVVTVAGRAVLATGPDGARAASRVRLGRVSRLSIALASVLSLVTGWWVVATGAVPGIRVSPGGTAPDAPAPGREEAARPLGVPAAVPDPDPSYRFIATQADGATPVAYDPCRPVHYVVRLRGEPAGAQELVHAAVAEVSRATGLRFVDDGATTESPSDRRPAYQPGRYGNRWAPVLIAWVTAAENPDFAGDVSGRGGSTRASLGGRPTVYVTGQVELDAAKLGPLLTVPDGRGLVRETIEHELGHLVGLAHVDDPSQVMYPRTVPGVTDFGAGDLTGLAALGRGPCVPQL